MPKFPPDVALMLKVVRAGDVTAVGVLCDALEEAGDQRARPLRLEFEKTMKACRGWAGVTARGRRVSPFDRIVYWFEDLLRTVSRTIRPGWKNTRYMPGRIKLVRPFAAKWLKEQRHLQETEP